MAKIFVVDDEPGFRRAVRRALETAGYEVVDFDDGNGAIERIEEDKPDLLISDIFMPGMEGIETIRKVRALRPEMPILAMSGFASEEFDYLPVAGKLGANATLKKPFRPADLCELVARLLSGEEPPGR